MLGCAACVGPGLASREVSVLVHPSQGQPHFLVWLEGKTRVEVGVGLGRGTGIPKALAHILWFRGGRRLSLSDHGKASSAVCGGDCPARRQETTLQTSHWTSTVSCHTYSDPQGKQASSQP